MRDETIQRYHLTIKSSNKKTGPIPVSTTDSTSCPTSCPLRSNGCYADSGPLKLHWMKVGKDRGEPLNEFCHQIRALPAGQLWRHNQAGDLPGFADRIDVRRLSRLVEANQGRRGFTYTHKPTTPAHVKAIRRANRAGFTINLSANNINHADSLMHHNLPVATVLPIDSPHKQTTPGGHRVVACPATYKDTDCAHCGLCQVSDRDFIVGFPVHGTSAKKANLIAAG